MHSCLSYEHQRYLFPFGAGTAHPQYTVHSIIMRLKTSSQRSANQKVPGPNLIPNKVVKCLPSFLVYLLLSLFNALLGGCVFPDEWKEAIVIGIHKMGKLLKLYSNYHPISLLSSVILARLIKSTCFDLHTRVSIKYTASQYIH